MNPNFEQKTRQIASYFKDTEIDSTFSKKIPKIGWIHFRKVPLGRENNLYVTGPIKTLIQIDSLKHKISISFRSESNSNEKLLKRAIYILAELETVVSLQEMTILPDNYEVIQL